MKKTKSKSRPRPNCGACGVTVEPGEEAVALPKVCRACEAEAVAQGLDGKLATRRELALPRRRGPDGSAISYESTAPWIARDGEAPRWPATMATVLRASAVELRQVQAGRLRAAEDRRWREKQRTHRGKLLDRREAALDKQEVVLEGLEAEVTAARERLEAADRTMSARKREAELRRAEGARDVQAADVDLLRAAIDDERADLEAEAKADAAQLHDAEGV